MKDKMFVVPGSFIPYNDTVTLLTYKRLRNLNLDFDVFCFKGKDDPGILNELKKDENFKKFSFTYTSDLDWAIPRNYPLRLPAGLFLMNKYIGDSLKEFEKGKYKYLFTSIVPGVSHLCGKKIKKKHPEVKWYASFSDPFKGSPYKKSDLSNTSIFYKIAFNVGAFFLYNNAYEEAAVKYADKLIFICEEQRDFTLSQYPNYEELKKKSIIMPLTYLPDWKMYQDIIDVEHEKNNVIQAAHLGRLYGLRKVTPFIEALRILKDEDPELCKKIVFHQYSEIQKNDVELIKKYNLEDVFVIHDKVSYKESINVMKNADVLLLFDTLMPGSKVQPYLPSKIVEYLLLKKPVLGVCDNNSPSYRILKEYGFDTVGSDVGTIVENIRKIIGGVEVKNYSLDELNADNYNMLKL